MPEFSPDDYFHQATQQWPAIAWSRQAYQAHLGTNIPKYPVDLFLAGAAGHRLDQAWLVIENGLGPQTRRILRRQPTADYELDDLWGDTILKLMDNHSPSLRSSTGSSTGSSTASPSGNVSKNNFEGDLLPDGRQPARIIRYRGKVKLLHYLILIAKRLAIGRQRKSKPSLLLSLVGNDSSNPEKSGHSENQIEDALSTTPDAQVQQNETTQNIIKALASAWEDLSAQQRFMIRMVYDRGMKQRDAGELLGVSPFKANRLIKKAMATLQTSLAQAVNEPWSPALIAAWAGVWTDHWENVDNLPIPLQDLVHRASESSASSKEAGK